MQKQTTALWICILTLGLFFVFPLHVSAEVIKSFDAQIVVQTENAISVTETIVYDSEGVEKHGIFRDITPRSSSGKMMDIKNVSVSDQEGIVIPWKRESSNGDVRLKIGDPNSTFVGLKTYVIRYVATDAVAHLDNNTDEIYWNVTGNNWPFDIENAKATVVLPSGAIQKQSSCYQGVEGATGTCTIEKSGIDFASTKRLFAEEGLTVAVGFPAGFVYDHIPTAKDKILHLLSLFWPLLIPIIAASVMFRRWYKKGRDAKGTGVIIPQYSAPDELSPIACAVILNQKILPRDIVAQVIYLATKGYISMTRTESKSFFIKKVDYILRLEKEYSTLENSSVDSLLLQAIFPASSVGAEVALSKCIGLQDAVNKLSISSAQEVVSKGYYTADFSRAKTKKPVFVFVVGFIVYTMIATLFVSSSGGGLLFTASAIIGLIIILIFNQIMPAKTKKGVLAKEHILGLKEYITFAEKDRIEFHNAPEKSPALFEQLLPYAIIFSQEKKWAKTFESIIPSAPSWYHGDSHFNAVVFASSLRQDFVPSFYSAAGLSSGSGGGGSSGGGGGGGGGGSW